MKKENNLLIEEFRKQQKEMEIEEKNKYLERWKKERDINEYQKKQAEEKNKKQLLNLMKNKK